jgi:hypothetical protein
MLLKKKAYNVMDGVYFQFVRIRYCKKLMCLSLCMVKFYKVNYQLHNDMPYISIGYTVS